MCKSQGSINMKWHPDKNHHSNKDKFGSIKEAFRALSIKKREEADTYISGDDEELHISSPKLLSRTTSYISPIPSPNLSKSLSRKCTTSSSYMNFYETSSSSSPSTPRIPKVDVSSFSKAATTPIFFSQSVVRRKPQPVEKKLECSLEELCLGCVKKIAITRDAISSSGLIVQEEETLSIKVKPGWKRGTKIIFEGKGDERPGSLPADIIFAIDEKKHPIFDRVGDDLELGVKIPLVQALTGSTICVPLLGGGHMTISIDDIVCPGYEKIIPGQGMPVSKKEGKRGDLRIKFLVQFPDELDDEQRLEVVRILEECS